jgi:hypothetical protein
MQKIKRREDQAEHMREKRAGDGEPDEKVVFKKGKPLPGEAQAMKAKTPAEFDQAVDANLPPVKKCDVPPEFESDGGPAL